MDRATLVLHAALWWNMSKVFMSNGLTTEIGLSAALGEMLDLCRSKGIDIPNEIYDKINPPTPARGR